MDFPSFVSKVFSYHNNRYCWNYYGNSTDESTQFYMVIPLTDSEFEMPTFALEKFENLAELTPDHPLPQVLVATLKCMGKNTQYKSFNKIMETVLREDLHKSGLIKIIGKDGDNSVTYYATHGALFDQNFKPVMMCLWKVRREEDKFSFQHPILRITPDFYLGRQDNVGRYINKKLLSGILSHAFYPPFSLYDSDVFLQRSYDYLEPKVEIAQCPFRLKEICLPSISTTNKELIDTVLDNMEDFKCQ